MKAHFLGPSAKLWNETIKLRHVRPYVRIEQLGSHRTEVREIWYLSVFRKYGEKFKFF